MNDLNPDLLVSGRVGPRSSPLGWVDRSGKEKMVGGVANVSYKQAHPTRAIIVADQDLRKRPELVRNPLYDSRRTMRN